MYGIVSHDAGGAEILSSWYLKQKANCLFALEGPAKKIFKNKCGNLNNVTINHLVEMAHTIICGTSWKSDLEKNAVRLGIAKNKKTISFLDHWVNYRQRFVKDGLCVLPNEIWVGDQYAYKIACNEFPDTIVKLVTNPFFEGILETISCIKNESLNLQNDKILYVTEPTSEFALKEHGDLRHFGYTEHEAFEFFLQNCSRFSSKKKQITIRCHPSESSTKYNYLLEKPGFNVCLSNKPRLIDDVCSNDIIVGCSSTAMVVGLLSGKTVYCSIPPWGPKCSLPHDEIIEIRKLK